jgi:hypothetical protein
VAVAAAEHNPNPFRLVGAEYIQIWTAVSLIDLEPTSEQLGGYARSYHEPFRVVAVWQSPLQSCGPVRQAAFLCIGALVANVLI